MPFGVFRGIVAERSMQGPIWTWSGCAEFEIQRYLRRFAPPGGHVYDIGGGDGLFALAFVKLTGEQCISFEAEPNRIQIMRAHLAHNPSLADRVEIAKAWVGTDLQVDDFAASRRQPTFLKVDVEGAEYRVLQSARRLLAETRPHLVVEVHGRDQETLCGDLLVELGYDPSIVPLRRRFRETGRSGVNFAINHWVVAEGSTPVRESVSARKRMRAR